MKTSDGYPATFILRRKVSITEANIRKQLTDWFLASGLSWGKKTNMGNLGFCVWQYQLFDLFEIWGLPLVALISISNREMNISED